MSESTSLIFMLPPSQSIRSYQKMLKSGHRPQLRGWPVGRKKLQVFYARHPRPPSAPNPRHQYSYAQRSVYGKPPKGRSHPLGRAAYQARSCRRRRGSDERIGMHGSLDFLARASTQPHQAAEAELLERATCRNTLQCRCLFVHRLSSWIDKKFTPRVARMGVILGQERAQAVSKLFTHCPQWSELNISKSKTYRTGTNTA